MRQYTLQRIGNSICTFSKKFESIRQAEIFARRNRYELIGDWIKNEIPSKVKYILSTEIK